MDRRQHDPGPVSYTHLAGSDKARTEAGETLLRLAKKHGAEVAAVGNGTAGRETEAFSRALPGWSIPVVMEMCIRDSSCPAQAGSR